MKSGGRLPPGSVDMTSGRGGIGGTAAGGAKGSLNVGSSGEDRDAQIEMLRNTKTFLTNKIKDNEKIIIQLQADLETMKELVRVEKQTKQKSQSLLSSREKELDELRTKFLEQESSSKVQIN